MLLWIGGSRMPESDCRPVQIVTIGVSDTVKDAAEMMMSHNVGCLIVNDEQGRFVGLVTERDVARHVATISETAHQLSIAHIMTDDVVSCLPGISTGEARRIMAARRVRHLPIIENGAVVGILSARDVMSQALIEDRTAAEEVAVLSNCLKSIDINEAAEIVAVEVPKLFQAKNCVLCLYGDDGTPAPALISSNRCPCFEGHFASRTIAADVPCEGGFYENDMAPECEGHGGRPPRLILPLEVFGLQDAASRSAKRLSGFLCMCGLPVSSTSNRELTLYKAKLTREIVVAHLTNALRYQQARLTSLTDALTGVGSRKLLEDALQTEYDRAQRYKRPFSIAIIDLDHFKIINDTLGHAAGDEAIRKMAQCMKSQKRSPDVLARYGGDEFVILMPETQAGEAAVLLERIRAGVQQVCLDQNVALTISCGIAESLPDRDKAASEMMRRADLALYEAKNAGRNCVKLWNKGMARALDTNDIEIEKIKRLQRRILGLSEKAEKMFMESIWGLVQALEAKDPYAKRHSENVMLYATAIAKTMEIGPKHIDLIRRAAMIHDIGRIGIPDAILDKPDALTAHERKIIEQHPVIAVRILQKMSFLEREIAIVRHHHEKWNGQGYPDGLARNAIPLGARVIAVADTFDALTASRSYHESRSVAEALEILKDSAGYDLDPGAVEAMVQWAHDVARQLGRTVETLTPDDLLSTGQTAKAEPVAAGAS